MNSAHHEILALASKEKVREGRTLNLRQLRPNTAMAGEVIEAPYTIASLPKPLDSDKGRIQAGVVYSFRGQRRRKRHELAIGIDGEGVNIYNVIAYMDDIVTSHN